MQNVHDNIDKFLQRLHIDPALLSSNQRIFMHAAATPAVNPNTGYLLLYYAASAKNVQFPVRLPDSQLWQKLITISGKDLDSLVTECEEALRLDGFEFESQPQTDAAGSLVAKTYEFKVFTRTELSRLYHILADFEELYGNKS